MIQETPQAERFKQQLRDSLRQEIKDSRAIKVAKHDHVYTCGDRAETVYFIESGQIKLLMLSPEGKECLLAIHTAGDIFGELCLSGLGSRLETAVAMEETSLKQIPCSSFFARLRRDLLFEGFVQYLAARIAELGLIETSAEQFLIIKEKKLTDYLAQIINSRTRQTNIRSLGQFNLNGERRPSSQDIASSLD